MTGRQGRRRKQLLGDIKEIGRYWKLKEAAQASILWIIFFGSGCGFVVRENSERIELM